MVTTGKNVIQLTRTPIFTEKNAMWGTAVAYYNHKELAMKLLQPTGSKI